MSPVGIRSARRWLLTSAEIVGVAVALVVASLALRLAFSTVAPAALEAVARL